MATLSRRSHGVLKTPRWAQYDHKQRHEIAVATPWHRIERVRTRPNADMNAVRAPFSRHSSAVRYPITPRERSEVAVRTLWWCVALARCSHGVLSDATALLSRLNGAFTALMRSVVYFTAFLQRLHGAVIAISPRCHCDATALLGILLRSLRRFSIVRTPWKLCVSSENHLSKPDTIVRYSESP